MFIRVLIRGDIIHDQSIKLSNSQARTCKDILKQSHRPMAIMPFLVLILFEAYTFHRERADFTRRHQVPVKISISFSQIELLLPAGVWAGPHVTF